MELIEAYKIMQEYPVESCCLLVIILGFIVAVAKSGSGKGGSGGSSHYFDDWGDSDCDCGGDCDD